METNINSILCKVRHLIHSNKIEEASLIAEPYTLATNYVLQHCNHKLDPMYKDFTVFKYKYTNPTFTGILHLGNGWRYGNGLGNGHGHGNGFDGYGYGHGNWSGNGSGDGYLGLGEGYGDGEG